jgi:gluconokinase
MIIVMGVSGCGKTTVGRMLAERLNLPFFDADDFHSPGNVAKMVKGIPLTDADREGWLRKLSDYVRQWSTEGGAVLACSALKEKYRMLLAEGAAGPVQWVWLHGTYELLLERLQQRRDHFMSARMLDSQLQDLEPPTYALKLDIANSPQLLTDTIIKHLAI